MKSVLMIAYHFPPLAGSSGIQRTLRFVQHLPNFGWQPLVLSADPRAYERTSADLEADIPAGTVVRRAFALDTARHLSIKGRYIGAMARPDRWISWRFDAVRVGMEMIRKHKPAAIWSTYPIATAHRIGAELQRRSGLPWIADFRDPMAQDSYPADPKTWQSYKDIEREAVARAALSTFTTPSCVEEYRQRYPARAQDLALLENGYDEDSFAHAGELASGGPLNPGAITLLHSGIVYPSERDPTQLMAALKRLHDAGAITPARLQLRFRAAVAEDLLRRLASEHGVLDYVQILPPVPYREALEEMLRADGLLLLQASNCNAQIPAKLYEYLRAGRPVLCLSDPVGDTARVLRDSGIDAIARLDDAADIARLLQAFCHSGSVSQLQTLARSDAIAAASRRGRSEALAGLLERVSSLPPKR
ncbi:glycosyltransferase [Pelomonas sp. V22]|uniref:glycosyltransferase n=1 Tax=Pelomonas sp. V22 TaxID=2822139 RepID=UPI0024A9A64F|nr:glycosyltransferase [Pelomonas sp. V22]MDI4631690.1 glycosyltransferase [Pelomonas sp. V22]